MEIFNFGKNSLNGLIFALGLFYHSLLSQNIDFTKNPLCLTSETPQGRPVGQEADHERGLREGVGAAFLGGGQERGLGGGRYEH